MELSECTYGTLVVAHGEQGDIVGMIIGITNNAPSADVSVRSEIDRAIPLVQWASGETSGIHPGNIRKYSK